MYCQRAGNDSERMFRELTLNGNPKSLESVLYCRAAQFVASTRAEKSAISVWWSGCSESAAVAASESHSQLRHSAMDADNRGTPYGIADPEKRASPLFPMAHVMK